VGASDAHLNRGALGGRVGGGSLVAGTECARSTYTIACGRWVAGNISETDRIISRCVCVCGRGGMRVRMSARSEENGWNPSSRQRTVQLRRSWRCRTGMHQCRFGRCRKRRQSNCSQSTCSPWGTVSAQSRWTGNSQECKTCR